jgi:hypothetical protein
MVSYIHEGMYLGFNSILPPHDEHEGTSLPTATDFFGLVLKSKNTVVKRWPNRLVHGKNDKPTVKDFNRYLGWADTVPRRWIEWKLVADPDRDAWQSYLNRVYAVAKGIAQSSTEEKLRGNASVIAREDNSASEGSSEEGGPPGREDTPDGTSELSDKKTPKKKSKKNKNKKKKGRK